MANATLANRRHYLGIGLAGEGLKYFAYWIGAVIVLALVLPPIIAQYTSIGISAWNVAANSGKFFTAIVAGTFLFSLLPSMIAQGMTRRELATSMGWFGLLWSLALGALAIGVFIVEHAIYSAFDWNQAVQEAGTDVQLGSIGDVLAFAGWYPLLYLLYFTGGALIGAATYRSDGGWLILVPVVPIVLTLDDAVSGSEPWGPEWLRSITSVADGLGTWPSAGAVLVAIALGGWICRRILIDTPIHPKQA